MELIEYSEALVTFYDITRIVTTLQDKDRIKMNSRDLPDYIVGWSNEFNRLYMVQEVEGWIDMEYLDTIEEFTIKKFEELKSKF